VPLQFVFASCIYVFECGHTAGIRSNQAAEPGMLRHCVTCDSEQLLTEVLTLR